MDADALLSVLRSKLPAAEVDYAVEHAMVEAGHAGARARFGRGVEEDGLSCGSMWRGMRAGALDPGRGEGRRRGPKHADTRQGPPASQAPVQVDLDVST